MIYLFSGTPGSGKSLHSAKVIYEKLQKGKTVISNFDINKNKIKHCKGEHHYIPNWELTPDKIIDISRNHFDGKKVKEDEILLIIDECQLIFNSRDWQQKGRNEWLSFFSQHRKFGVLIILVAQFDKMIDRQIRGLIEYDYIHRKVANYGFFGAILSMFALGKLFVNVKMWYPLKEKIGSQFFVARPKYYSLYDTFNTFDS